MASATQHKQLLVFQEVATKGWMDTVFACLMLVLPELSHYSVSHVRLTCKHLSCISKSPQDMDHRYRWRMAVESEGTPSFKPLYFPKTYYNKQTQEEHSRLHLAFDIETYTVCSQYILPHRMPALPMYINFHPATPLIKHKYGCEDEEDAQQFTYTTTRGKLHLESINTLNTRFCQDESGDFCLTLQPTGNYLNITWHSDDTLLYGHLVAPSETIATGIIDESCPPTIVEIGVSGFNRVVCISPVGCAVNFVQGLTENLWIPQSN